MGESHHPGAELEGAQLSVAETAETPGEPGADSKRDAEFGDGAEAGMTDGTDSGVNHVSPDSGVDPVGSA
jgi:hypothetical protein